MEGLSMAANVMAVVEISGRSRRIEKYGRSGPEAAAVQARVQLHGLENSQQQKPRHQTMCLSGFRAMRWSFQSTGVEKLVFDLEKSTQLIRFAL
ncbi:unnamed protein product [Clonostachys rosea]|uniref:Uncharacterized protein n=1 Tax=Bionectria ochroleuca TaxID=29856 RepID=A0ABY6TRS8_BIOOC|nr:unnamed protein product [Clonostachys rosea]